MRTESILMSMIAFVVAVLLIAAGLGSLILSWYDRDLLNIFIVQLASHAFLFGLLCIVFGAALLILCGVVCRHNYLPIKMGGSVLSDKVLSQLTKECLSRTFPGCEVACDVVVRSNKKIEIFADLPSIEFEEREKRLCEIEESLAQMLASQCGFFHPFLFHARYRHE